MKAHLDSNSDIDTGHSISFGKYVRECASAGTGVRGYARCPALQEKNVIGGDIDLGKRS